MRIVPRPTRGTKQRQVPKRKPFQIGVPSARVVLLPHANHFVFISNEGDVLREMNTFLSSLI